MIGSLVFSHSVQLAIEAPDYCPRYHSFARVLFTPGFDCLSPASFRETLCSGPTVFRTDTDAVSLRELLLLLFLAVVIIVLLI